MNSKNYCFGKITSVIDSRVVLLASISSTLILIVMIQSNLIPIYASGQETVGEENNIKAARQVIDAFNTGDVDNVTHFISPQYFNHESQVDPVRGMLRGPEEFIDTVKNLRTAFPNLHHEEESIITQGDMVISIINVTGTHTGNFFILPPTGKNISYEAVHLYRIGEDGKIVEHKAIRDDLTFLAQLDIVEPTSPEYEPFFEALTGTSNSSR
jgi:steroid delta-isomerase-like uncharacterized protein